MPLLQKHGRAVKEAVLRVVPEKRREKFENLIYNPTGGIDMQTTFKTLPRETVVTALRKSFNLTGEQTNSRLARA